MLIKIELYKGCAIKVAEFKKPMSEEEATILFQKMQKMIEQSEIATKIQKQTKPHVSETFDHKALFEALKDAVKHDDIDDFTSLLNLAVKQLNNREGWEDAFKEMAENRDDSIE